MKRYPIGKTPVTVISRDATTPCAVGDKGYIDAYCVGDGRSYAEAIFVHEDGRIFQISTTYLRATFESNQGADVKGIKS